MTLIQMIKDHFENSKLSAACAAEITMTNLNMCISRKYQVIELKEGGFVMLTSKTKIFKQKACTK